MKGLICISSIFLVICFLLLYVACTPNEAEVLEPENAIVSEVLDTSDNKTDSTDYTSDITLDDLNDTLEITVLKSTEFQNGAHKVSGNIEFLSDNTIKLSNFSYDGKAPDVYIALGKIENDVFIYEILASPEITGAFENQSLVLPLNSDINLENYTAVSVWCHNFSEDFSSNNLI